MRGARCGTRSSSNGQQTYCSFQLYIDRAKVRCLSTVHCLSQYPTGFEIANIATSAHFAKGMLDNSKEDEEKGLGLGKRIGNG